MHTLKEVFLKPIALKKTLTISLNLGLFNHWRKFGFIACWLLTSGCTHTLLVDGKFPSPLISEIPISIGVVYPEEFKKYTYKEDSEERTRWIIDIGAAQTDMMEAILPNMFNAITEVDGIPIDGSHPELQLVMIPSVETFQYTLPTETRVKIYEIFIKYNIQVLEPNGTIVADWILTAYGKTPTGFMQSDEGALNQAIIVALRDAGANLSLNFGQVPEIRAWMDQHLN